MEGAVAAVYAGQSLRQYPTHIDASVLLEARRCTSFRVPLEFAGVELFKIVDHSLTQ
jgi:hypothetical protein